MGSHPDGSSVFSEVEKIPPDAVYGLKEVFAADADDRKIILGSGIYRGDQDNIVQETQGNDRYEYLPILGDSSFYTAARNLLFGSDIVHDTTGRIVSVHTAAGTGANNLGARFLKEALVHSVVWLSSPTWVNHHNIYALAGYKVKQYPYWDNDTRSLAFNRMIGVLETEASPNDVVVLHACAHNPTGVDPTREQWRRIADVCRQRRLFPFFDCAYLGFATGDLDADAWAVRYFAAQGFEFAVAQSFSKNMGLYGERVGAFHLHTLSEDAADRAKSQLTRMQRGTISTPPTRGARIAETIMNSPQLMREWKEDLQVMSGRIAGMRRKLRDELMALETPGDWTHIVSQIGMFSYSGLSTGEVQTMARDHHVYLLSSGRISVAGLTSENVGYVSIPIEAAVRKTRRGCGQS